MHQVREMRKSLPHGSSSKGLKMHLFDTKRLKNLDDPQRTAQIPIDKIANELQLNDGMSLADIGCGSGLFSYAFAEYIKPHGKLVGFDIQKACIDHCESKKTSAHKHISFVLNESNTINAKGNSFDAAVMIVVAHELSKPEEFLKEVNRILKPGAKLAIIEWQMARTKHGPDLIERIAPNILESLLKEAGFSVVVNEISSENHYLIIAQKSDVGTIGRRYEH
jgi:ubiquinone/menaquinone biosynthesis C-methylase UbiE